MTTTMRLITTALTLSFVSCAPKVDKKDLRTQGEAPSDDAREETPEDRQDDRDNTALADGTTAALRIVETTDLHVNMETFDYYTNAYSKSNGFVRTAVAIRKVRDAVTNSILIDNGDLIQGSPLGDWFKKNRDPKVDLHTVYKAMNLLGYDAANVGNHEFNYGVDFLEATLNGATAKFPYVSANVRRTDNDGDDANDAYFVQPYTMLKRSLKTDDGQSVDVTIGVIGFAPPQIMAWDRSNLLGKLNARDIVETAQAMVPKMRAEGADIVIAVPHSGISTAERKGNDENAVFYLAGVAGIDAILSGHSHLRFPDPKQADSSTTDIDHKNGLIKGVPVVMAGSWGSHIGIVDLKLKRVAGAWKVETAKGEAAVTTELVGENAVAQDVRDAVATDHAATLEYLGQSVGATERAIYSYFSLVTPSPAVQVVHDAQLWYGKKALEEGGDAMAALRNLPLLSASAPLKASGVSGYTDVAAGQMTLRNVADMYVYPNTVHIVKVTGAMLTEWIERAAGAYNTIDPTKTEEQFLQSDMPAYNNDQIAGVSYEIDVTQPSRYNPKDGALLNPASHRVANLTYNGVAIDPAAEFLVVTNNYRANGGGNFGGLNGSATVLDAGRESRDILREYVASKPMLSVTPDLSWRLKPVPGTTVIFKTGTKAPNVAEDVKDVLEFVRADQAPAPEFTYYKMKW